MSNEDNWNDLRDRLERAVVSVSILRFGKPRPERQRLAGKREGIRLALDYMRSYPEGDAT